MSTSFKNLHGRIFLTDLLNGAFINISFFLDDRLRLFAIKLRHRQAIQMKVKGNFFDRHIVGVLKFIGKALDNLPFMLELNLLFMATKTYLQV